MRLIDADALIESVCHTADLGGWIGDTLRTIKRLAVRYINSAPTIDAVEVVRCRDCKWLSMTTIGMDYACWHGAYDVFGENGKEAWHTVCRRIENLDHYCSFAEPKAPQKRCGNCKFLTFRWGKVWCDIRCENPTVDVCDKWKRSE